MSGGAAERRRLRRLQAAAHVATIKADLAAGAASAARVRQEAAEARLRDCLDGIDAPASQVRLVIAGVALDSLAPLSRQAEAAAAETVVAATAAGIARARTKALDMRVAAARGAIEKAEAAGVLFEALLRGKAQTGQLPES